jgi:hypothetical protein
MSIPNVDEIIREIFGQLTNPAAIPVLLTLSPEDFEKRLVSVGDQLIRALQFAGVSADLELRLQELGALRARLAAADRTNAAFAEQIAGLRASVQDLSDQVIQRETTKRASNAARAGRTAPQHKRNEEVDEEDGEGQLPPQAPPKRPKPPAGTQTFIDAQAYGGVAEPPSVGLTLPTQYRRT